MPDVSAGSSAAVLAVRDRGGTSAAVPGTSFTPRPSRAGTWRLVVILVVVAALVVAWFSTRPSGPAYRTAAVTTGTATATLDEVGTVTPVQQSNLTFTVAGTVGAVDVSVGQQVTAGEVVASLEPTSLDTAVVNAQASLASAQATLAADETSEADGTSSSTTGSGTNGAGGSSPASGGSSGSGVNSTAASAEVAGLQTTLVAAQHAQDAAATAAGAALQQATTACSSSSSSSSSSSTASTATPAASSSAGGSSGTGAGDPGDTSSAGSGGSGASCSQALAAASTAHEALVAAIAQVTKDEAALAAALGVTATSGSGTVTGQGGSGRPTTTALVTGAATATLLAATSGNGSGTGSGSSSSSSGGHSGTVTPEVIALDEADVDVAQAALAAAQQNVDDANLVSPIAGTVGSVTLTAGQSVSAGSPSATPQIVVVGSGSEYQVATTVAVTDIQKVKVGQEALVTPDSSAVPITGTVTGIGVLGTSTTSTTTYPVTITLQSQDLGPFSGADSTVQIVISRARGVVTVPTSAVRTVGTTKVVTVIAGGTPKTVRVTVGTVGALATQIRSGVHVGESVSLATMADPVPSSSTTTRSGFAGLGGASGLSGAGGAGGFGGTGRFGGGGGFASRG